MINGVVWFSLCCSSENLHQKEQVSVMATHYRGVVHTAVPAPDRLRWKMANLRPTWRTVRSLTQNYTNRKPCGLSGQ